MKRKIKEKKMLGPVIAIILLTMITIGLSTTFSLLEIDAEKTEIVRDSLETSLVTVNNILTKEGIIYVLNNVVKNLQVFEPLFLLIISLITISIGEASGLFKSIFYPFRKISSKFLTFLTLLVGVSGSIIGDYSYVILLPLVAILYKYTGKKPLLGIMTVFIGITMGYGTGLLYNNEEIVLAKLTETAASLDVDKNFIYLLKSNMYIMFASTFILSVVGTFIIHSVLEKRVPKSNIPDDENIIISKKALYYSNLAFFLMIIILTYMIIPGLKGSGFLLGEGNSYIERLMGNNSPFKNGLPVIFLLIVMICGFIYGKISGNIKNSTQYSVGLSKNFEGLGYVFVLLFFTSQFIGILEWTNLGEVISCKLVTLLTSLPFSGIPLVAMFFLIVILMSILVPSAVTKWTIASPLAVPLLMRSNITPNFSQFIFRAADGVGKCFTPIYPYYIIMLAFLEKYNTKENNKITVFGTFRIMMPALLLFAGLWILIIMGWYIVGLSLGPETFSTY